MGKKRCKMENMDVNTNFSGIYFGKKVLITGNTGFKGTWLAEWLNELGAEVVGVSDCILTEPSMYSLLETQNRVKQYFNDINERNNLYKSLFTIFCSSLDQYNIFCLYFFQLFLKLV